MANASGPAVDGLEAGSFLHAVSGVQYRVFQESGAAWLSYERPGDGAMHGRQKLEYFMGSGNHGRTYLYSVNGYWFETPIAWYARKHGYDMRPAYLNDKEMPFNLPMNASCLRCHVSGPRVEDAGTRNHYGGAPFAQGGITCVACHGDGAQHVRSGGSGATVNPAKLDAERRDSVCISCHLEGDVAVPRLGRSPVSYRPGERIADYVSYFVRRGANTASRAVSQVEALNQSRCKRMSADRMSCMTCHDPHRSVGAGERVKFYRSKCLGCHVQAKYAAAHYATTSDCTRCHMPKSAPTDIPHEQWTDHRILRTPGAAEFEPAFTGEDELVAVPGIRQQPSERDLALGYYNLVADGDISQMQRARKLLETVLKADAKDVEVLKAQGVLAQMQNDRAQAVQFYRSVLDQAPNDYTASLNLGVLLARSGQLKPAADLWSRSFAQNEDITELGMNLASVRCMLGDGPGAEQALRRVLLYSPDHRAARERMRAIESGAQPCSGR
jgi:predicted CXXCH cytochrome family protein